MADSAVKAMQQALEYADQWLDYRVWKLRAPGAQVAVWFDGKVQFSKAYGLSNIDTGEALTTSHLFRIASHSKTFTATAIMQLVEAGKLRLDDTAGQWIPQLTEGKSPLANVTVRELVSHSAGVIRDGVDSTYWAHAKQFPDETELLRISIEEGDVRVPQATFKYTNIGFSLLGMIIGAASQSSYNEYQKSAIVGKLGLKNTGPELDADRLSEYAGGHSGLHSWETRQVIEHIDTHAMAAATGFYSTAEDMVQFASAHFFGDDRLISDKSKAEMQRPVWSGMAGDDPRAGYGYGTTVHFYDGHKMVGHSGGYPGHITRTMWDPTEGLAISVLTNAVDGPAEELAAGILKILDKAREGSPKLALTSGFTNSLNIAPTAKPEKDIDPATFCGRFAALWGVTDVFMLGEKLFASSPVSPLPLFAPYELAIINENELRITSGSEYASVGERFRYERDDEGKILSVYTGGMRAWPIEDYRSRDRVL